MIISQIILKNWRNFQSADVKLSDRVFLIGPNASGKSNFLDAFRFLHDIAKPKGGGLQQAITERKGLSKIRCLAARQDPNVEITVYLSEMTDAPPLWEYAIGLKQQSRGEHKPILAFERVRNLSTNEIMVDRPSPEDKTDELRLTQTHLEQINANAKFRQIAHFFETAFYLHLVPQLLRNPEAFSGQGLAEDPFGKSFLDRVASTPEKYTKSRLKKIESALRIAVPQLKHLSQVKDERGKPHLEAVYAHWRPKGAKQQEDQFSDGTLRLIGLLWSLLESDSLLLLEEPELSLNAGIVRRLPALIYRLQREKKRQIIISTHSADLLSDEGIDANEVLLLKPHTEGTQIIPASNIREIKDLLESGLSLVEAVFPHTIPSGIHQLELGLDENGNSH